MEQSNNNRFSSSLPLPGALANAPLVSHALFGLGDQVKHKILGFSGIVFDIDPVFANSEEWYEAIPVALRPDRDQPFYHLLADNGEQSYVAYVSQQNLVMDEGAEPIDHPAVAMLFQRAADGGYELDAHRWH
jgi:heat shock protein HspQ